MSLTIIWWFLPTLCSRSWEEESSSGTTGPPASNLSIVRSQTTRKGQTHWHFGSIFTAGPAKEENQAAVSSWKARKAEGSAGSPATDLVTFCFVSPILKQKTPPRHWRAQGKFLSTRFIQSSPGPTTSVVAGVENIPQSLTEGFKGTGCKG